MSPQETNKIKQVKKRLRTQEDAAEPEAKKNHLNKKKTAAKPKGKEKPRGVRPEVVLMESAKGVSYAEVPKNLRKKVKPDEVGVKF